MQTTHHTATTPSLKEKQRQEREELIIQAAEEVLLEKGYYETSMDEIAARVGIAKGTIYKHFPGKEDLVLGIFQRDMKTLIEGIDDVIAQEQTPGTKLKALLFFTYTGFFSKHTQLFASMYNGIDMKRLLVEKGGCMRELWDVLVVRIKQLFEDGKTVGEFDTSIPTSVMALSFFSMFSPKMYDRILVGEDISREDTINYLWHIFFKGIASSATR